MSTFLARAGAVVFSVVAMLALLLGLAALAFGRLEGTAAYLLVAGASAVVVGVLMRRDVRRRRAEEALLARATRPARHTPRRPVTFPLRETTLTFGFWYAVVAAIDGVRTGAVSAFTLAAIAPFASFMLTTITVAGRHMAFRLTAEEAADDKEP